jgi:S-adenosylmethionine:tRNA-ribosyltransferase-isomerase (queuine synthetase)
MCLQGGAVGICAAGAHYEGLARLLAALQALDLALHVGAGYGCLCPQ